MIKMFIIMKKVSKIFFKKIIKTGDRNEKLYEEEK